MRFERMEGDIGALRREMDGLRNEVRREIDGIRNEIRLLASASKSATSYLISFMGYKGLITEADVRHVVETLIEDVPSLGGPARP